MNFDGQLFDFISQETGLHHLRDDFPFVEFNVHFEDVDKRRAAVVIGQHLVDGRRRLHFPTIWTLSVLLGQPEIEEMNFRRPIVIVSAHGRIE